MSSGDMSDLRYCLRTLDVSEGPFSRPGGVSQTIFGSGGAGVKCIVGLSGGLMAWNGA